MEYHDLVAPSIPYQTYVIDYLVTKDTVKVIELNPFVSIFF